MLTAGLLCSPWVAADDAPSTEQAVAAWITADAWVRTGEVPPAESEKAQVPLSGVEAVSIVLRLGGRIVAVGEDAEGGPEMLRRATGRLLSECSATLRQRWPEAMHDALRRQSLLEIDLAGPAEPLLGSTFAEAAAAIDPGRDALAFRRGNRWARAYPGRLLAAGLAGDPATTFGRLATETGLPRGAGLPELLALDSIGVYRMPTVRLGQFESGGLPEPLIRQEPEGNAPTVDASGVRTLAADLLRHLQRQRHESAAPGAENLEGQTRGLGLRGDHDPISGRHDPFTAPPLAQAIAVLAATRLAEADEDLAPVAGPFARQLLADLARVDPIEASPLESLEALAVVSIAAALDPTLAAEDAATAALVDAADDAIGRAIRPEAFESLTPGLKAIVAAAAASNPGVHGAEGTTERLNAAWNVCDDTTRVGLMPWFAWAARQAPDAGDLAGELDRFRTRLLELQIERSSALDPAEDLLGGFDLERGPRPRSDARSVLPGLGLAIMLADGDLTPRSADANDLQTLRRSIVSQREVLGFLQRLAVSSLAAATLPHGDIARGGIRDAAWDSRQSIMVQAIALWWLAECIDSGLP
ncbi:MAG: hypothetical protein ACO3P9_03280 [Phycisphaerales bacterium]